MSSARLVDETGENTFAANKVTRTFANPGFQGGVYHVHDYAGPGMLKLPDFLKERQYRDVYDGTDTALLEAWGSLGIPVFAHYPTQPALFAHFQQFMPVQRLGMQDWLDVYPYQAAARSLKSPDQVFFVDIGGSFGHQTIAIRKALPQLPNKFVNQDLPEVLAMPPTVRHPGIEHTPFDFWKPQPVQGAKLYYLRNIIHDYPHEEAVKLLKLTKAALGPDSVILIDDMYLPNTGIHWHATQIDITMMSGLAAVERNEAQWHSLIADAGLKIQKVYTYEQSRGDSIIECVPVY